MSDETVLEERSGGVCTLTLARPDKKNALSLAMYERLGAVLQTTATDPEIRVVLLRGLGGTFSAGNDLADFLAQPASGLDSPVARFLQALMDTPKPVVAAVEGVAIGIGTTMLLHCDLVYAAEGTRFQLPFTALGLCPEAGSSWLLPRMCGHARAAELLLLGEPFGPEQAHELGIVSAVVGADRLHEHARARADAVAALPPGAVLATKRLMKLGDAEQLRRHFEVEAETVWERLRSPEAVAAIQARRASR